MRPVHAVPGARLLISLPGREDGANMAAHEPFDAREVASLDGEGSFGHVGLVGARADGGKDAFRMDGKEIWSSWPMGSEGDGPKILARDSRTAHTSAMHSAKDASRYNRLRF